MRSGRGGGKNVGCRVTWTVNILFMLWLCVKRIDQTAHVCSIFHVHVSQGSVADRVSDVPQDGQCSIPDRGRQFYLCHRTDTSFWAHPCSYPVVRGWGRGVWRVKQAKRDANSQFRRYSATTDPLNSCQTLDIVNYVNSRHSLTINCRVYKKKHDSS